MKRYDICILTKDEVKKVLKFPLVFTDGIPDVKEDSFWIHKLQWYVSQPIVSIKESDGKIQVICAKGFIKGDNIHSYTLVLDYKTFNDVRNVITDLYDFYNKLGKKSVFKQPFKLSATCTKNVWHCIERWVMDTYKEEDETITLTKEQKKSLRAFVIGYACNTGKGCGSCPYYNDVFEFCDAPKDTEKQTEELMSHFSELLAILS